MQPSDFIGRPWENRTHDCWVVCKDVCAEVYDITIPSYADTYSDSEDGSSAAFAMWSGINNDRWQLVDEPQAGDVLLFRIGRWACHAGVFVGDNDFIHCLRGRSTVIQSLSTEGWQARVKGIYRWTH